MTILRALFELNFERNLRFADRVANGEEMLIIVTLTQKDTQVFLKICIHARILESKHFKTLVLEFSAYLVWRDNSKLCVMIAFMV